MIRHFLPVAALLLGSALLLFAGGINALLLPVRGSAEGFSATALGLLGTAWAIGYVSGCLLTPRLVGRVGHIRSFSVMCALAAVAILMSLVLIDPAAWLPLRAISGFCFAGAAMIVESWLSERTDPGSRGRVFGIYTMVNLAATTAGQMALTLGSTAGYTFFVIGAVFYCLALVPTAISSSAAPNPLVSVKLDLRGLWRNSPVAVVGVFLVGISNSAFGTLAAVYADRVGLVLTTIALFTSIPILAGAASQIPVGWMSDRVDRRKVLILLALLAMVADAAFILLAPEGRAMNLALAALFGASVFAMYPVILAHANDHAAEGSFIQTSGGLLMVFGLGSIIGPLAAGIAMSKLGEQGLFLTSVVAHALLILFTLSRIALRAAVAEKDKSGFVAATPGRPVTPETAAMALEVQQDQEKDAA
ncbi:MFS transporter [Meridianimarinicoccus roseus]|jgi:MFS family permease|uniref:MFS transporter n=1 Tax=Meridianimarinicoccus roseus TaxID=2072018 RepID=A0A2V2LL10_9RHOB|nr:MFS transporter [Meridianimarinicoccus roseus]PWR02483.1 MFS transporter [Meridianimarinicoccus roseus]